MEEVERTPTSSRTELLKLEPSENNLGLLKECWLPKASSPEIRM